MWFIRTPVGASSNKPELMHITSKENRAWINEQIDLRLIKLGLLNSDQATDDLRKDMSFLAQFRKNICQIKQLTIATLTRAAIGGLLTLIGFGIASFIGDLK